VRIRHLYLLGVAVAVAALVGWGVGSAHSGCEHSCPAQGPCPTPADCLQSTFHWTAAVVLGLVAAIVVTTLGLISLRRRDDGQPWQATD
jgi:hypothetical protein